MTLLTRFRMWRAHRRRMKLLRAAGASHRALAERSLTAALEVHALAFILRPLRWPDDGGA